MSRLKITARLLMFCLVLAVSRGYAGIPVNGNGIPLVRNFSEKDYKAFAQNWSCIRDERGIMMFANSLGLLQFDGKNWRLVSAGDGEMLLSLCSDSDGVIWFGTSRRFGCLYAGAKGRLRLWFASDYLLPGQNSYFEYWKIVCKGPEVYFFSEQNLFRIDKSRAKFDRWNLNNNYFQIHLIGDRLLLSHFDLGLQELVNDSIVPVNGGDFFSGKAIVSILPAGTDSALVFTYYDGVFRYCLSDKNPEWLPLNPRLNAKLASMQVYSVAALGNRGYALGTIGSGLMLMDGRGDVHTIIDESTGLISNNISYVYSVSKGPNVDVVWLCTDKGIACAEVNSPVRRMGAESGLKGFVQDVVRYKGILYIATTEGVFRLLPAEFPEKSVFHKLDIIQQSAWKFFIPPDTGSKQRLYVCTSLNVYEVSGDAARALPGTYYFNCAYSPRLRPDVVYFGIDKGLVKGKILNGQLTIEEAVKNSGVSHDIRSICGDGQGNLWLRTSASEVISYDPGRDTMIRMYNPGSDTIASYSVHCVFTYNGSVFLGAGDGILEYFPESDSFRKPDRFVRSGLANLEVLRIRVFGQHAWAFIREGQHNRIATVTFSDGRWFTLPTRRILEDNIWCFYEDGRDWVCFGATDNLYMFNNQKKRKSEGGSFALIRRVFINTDSLIYDGSGYETSGGKGPRVISGAVGDPLAVPYRYHNLSFEYASPFFEATDAIEYSYLLEGNDDEWSAWSTQTSKEYTNLYEGEYTFRVVARNVYGEESIPATFRFTILPPWYRTWWAYALYALLMVATVYGIVRLSVYRLRRINEAYGKYLPGSFLKMLGKRRIIDFRLGDMAEKEMSVMFSDIRSYTSLSESMSPQDNFRFLVRYLKYIGEVLNRFKGFPVQYYGDGIMAMFHGKTDQAVNAALQMHRRVAEYSAERLKKGRRSIKIGVGIHYGSIIMGIRGDQWRWEGGIVGDSVNIASRIEGLTKIFGVQTIITGEVKMRIAEPENFVFRFLGKVKVKGKDHILDIYEVVDPGELMRKPVLGDVLSMHEQAIGMLMQGDTSKALGMFQEIAEKFGDEVSKGFIKLIPGVFVHPDSGEVIMEIGN